MHSRLEGYLSEVAARLGPLPVKARDEELREMRAHLEAALAAGLERGQSDDEAARGVLAQFGTPEAVGAGTVRAWRRGVARSRRSFWGAGAASFVLLTVLVRLMLWLQLTYLQQFAPHPPPVRAINLALSWGPAVCLLFGGVVGVLFPRRAVAVAGLAWSGFIVQRIVFEAYHATHARVWAMNFALSWGPVGCLLFGGIVGIFFPRRAVSAAGLACGAWIVWSIMLQAHYATQAVHRVGFPLSFIRQEIVWYAVSVSLSLLAAWAGSRWRTRGGRGGVGWKGARHA